MVENDEKKYRRHAEECLKQADKAISPPDRQAWLDLAEGWLKLALAEQLRRDG
jgi:hypothetical protein